MKIYEISYSNGDDPTYAKSKKELKEELRDCDKSAVCVNEYEFEYNLNSICKLCSDVWR